MERFSTLVGSRFWRCPFFIITILLWLSYALGSANILMFCHSPLERIAFKSTVYSITFWLFKFHYFLTSLNIVILSRITLCDLNCLILGGINWIDSIRNTVNSILYFGEWCIAELICTMIKLLFHCKQTYFILKIL